MWLSTKALLSISRTEKNLNKWLARPIEELGDYSASKALLSSHCPWHWPMLGALAFLCSLLQPPKHAVSSSTTQVWQLFNFVEIYFNLHVLWGQLLSLTLSVQDELKFARSSAHFPCELCLTTLQCAHPCHNDSVWVLIVRNKPSHPSTQFLLDVQTNLLIFIQ